MNKAVAFAPATVANIGVGFDILGLALDNPGDTISAEFSDTPGVTVAGIEGDGGKLPRDPNKNTACVAGLSVLRAAGSTQGVALTIQKGLPAASGLGSSAASAVGAAVAVNALLGEPLTRDQLLAPSLDGEAIASGYHADNVAPCLFGGITLSYGIEAHQIERLPIPRGLSLALVTPHVEVATAMARAVLPKEIPLKSMVKQTGSVARLIRAIYTDDLESMAAAMEADVVVEPARAHLMPGLFEARRAAKAAGALALVISGAGPTLCAVCASHETALQVVSALEMVYAELGLGCTARAASVSEQGSSVQVSEGA
ncbi:MAG: homoserine kinase [Chloroflexi bacterium]|nr:homoserine kinase [Chloroflexota bacterium]